MFAYLQATAIRNQQPTSKSAFGQSSSVDMGDLGLRGPLSLSPPGSTSPRPLQQMPTRLPAPPRASGPSYWPCEPHPWAAMSMQHRFMMDPRMFMMSARGPMPGCF